MGRLGSTPTPNGGPAIGDTLLAFVTGSPTITTASIPGFTALITDADNPPVHLLRRVVDGSEGGTVTLTTPNAQKKIVLALISGSTGVDVLGTPGQSANTAVSTAPGITALTAGLLLGYFGRANTGTVGTPPVGMDQVTFATGGVSVIGVYKKENNPPGATGDKTLAWSPATGSPGCGLPVQLK